MTETPIPPKQSGTDSGNDDLPSSRPSGNQLFVILLVIAAVCSIPVIILAIVWSSG